MATDEEADVNSSTISIPLIESEDAFRSETSLGAIYVEVVEEKKPAL